MLDERWIRSLHVESLRRENLHAEHRAHVLFQASTIGALLEGAYEGDVTFAELGEHGDLGLGTLNSLDGEMLCLDGEFFRADVDGVIHRVEPSQRTPFAVVVWFTPTIELEIAEPVSHEQLASHLDAALPAGTASAAVRIDGEFESVRARSVPRQHPPYRPLTEVVGEQKVFELADVSGTMVGFRFPDYAEGIEVSGYHLHFVTEDRTLGGHVLDGRAAGVEAKLDPSADLHVELPPGVDLADPRLHASTREALDRVEHQG